jgi:hypothetical protein
MPFLSEKAIFGENSLFSAENYQKRRKMTKLIYLDRYSEMPQKCQIDSEIISVRLIL